MTVRAHEWRQRQQDMAIIWGRFLAGRSVALLAQDMGLTRDDIEDALRAVIASRRAKDAEAVVLLRNLRGISAAILRGVNE